MLHAVNRVGPAALLAGAVALALANGHVYWAVAFSLLILNQGGTRLAQTHRAVQRLLGTLLGLVAYGFVLRLQPDAWVVVMVVVVLQFAVEMMVTRNYGVAVIFLTPLALTVATAAAPGAPVDTLVADRALDTVIAVASALLVLWLTGRVRPELQLRAHARQVVLALQAVLDDLATGQVDGPVALFHRRRLHHELLESRTVAQRSAADAPARVGPYLQLERDLTRMGHLVLGACWHPDLRRSGERFAAASKQLAPITEHPVARHRSAAELSAQLRAVEAALTGAGQP
ncbi:FUSC family protein [Propionibacteriaceae bacterium Y2011]